MFCVSFHVVGICFVMFMRWSSFFCSSFSLKRLTLFALLFFFIFISSCYICSTVDAQQFVWLSHAIFTVCFFSVCIILLWYRKDKRFLYCTKKREEKMINTKDMKQICTWRMSHFNFSHPFRTLWNENAFFMFLTRIFTLNRGFVSNIWHDTCECTGTPLSFCYLTWIGAWVKV